MEFPSTEVLYGCESLSLKLKQEHRLRVFDNRVLRRIVGLKRDEMTGGSRKLHNEELNNFYSSTSIIRMLKPRRIMWAGHVARMGRTGMHTVYWWKSQNKRDHYEDQYVGGWIILKCILEKEDGVVRTGLI
jgi:hypothetical protein